MPTLAEAELTYSRWHHFQGRANLAALLVQAAAYSPSVLHQQLIPTASAEVTSHLATSRSGRRSRTPTKELRELVATVLSRAGRMELSPPSLEAVTAYWPSGALARRCRSWSCHGASSTGRKLELATIAAVVLGASAVGDPVGTVAL